MNNQEAMLENMDVAQLEELRARVKARGNKVREGRNVITPLSRDAALPLSFAQQRLWFLTQLDGATDAYHIPLALRLSGPLDRDAWRQALDALFARHEALRSVFVTHDGEPVLQLLDPSHGMPCRECDLCAAEDAEHMLEHLCAEESRLPFDLSRGPLVRAQLIRLASDQHVFLLTQHHIVSDGWSMSILLRELQSLYGAFVQGHADPLPPLAIQYPDYAAWQRQWLSGERLLAQADFWRRSLADAPTLITLPTDHPRPPQQSFAGASVAIVLDVDLARALRRLSQQQGCTLFMTLMAAWAVVLARLSGQNDLVIGTASANRRHRQVEPLIGFFVNTLALHIDLAAEPSVAELLEQLRIKALAAQDHQDLPFEQVVDIVQPPRRLDHTPLFQVMFAWQNNEEARLDLPGLQVEAVRAPFDHVKYDLELVFGEQGECIAGELNYATALFDRATIERQGDYLIRVLRAMVADAHQSVSRIDVLGDDERELLLHTWNRTEAPYPDTICIHQLFEQQVRHAPDTLSVVGQDHTLTYRQLNERANRLAHHLIALGVKPDDRVAICMDRSPDLLVGLLAILKAGGAYVPLDPAYPSERLNGVLRDAAPVLLLSDSHGRTALGADALAALRVVDLDHASAWEQQSDINPQVRDLTSRHLAYVIYTSGSTGTPKGVMVEHRQLANLVQWHTTRFELVPGQRVAMTAGVAFDACAWEIWPSLSAGGTLLMSGVWGTDPMSLLRWWQAQTIDSGFLATALAEMALDGPWMNRGLRYLLIGGDRLSRLPRNLPETPALINNYGPTETTVVATSGRLLAQDDVLHIGRPIANTRIYVLDAHGQPVPLGAVGEIHIGGAGVARGYLHRPELTAERFLPDPFVSNQDARMYKTGDLARYLPDGNLAFIGRNDQQVKIRGFRIEPGEIEARLLEHDAVREVVVMARTDKDGDPRLVAYIVAVKEHAQEQPALLDRLHGYLHARLPTYMVPAAFVTLDALPLTPNGKLDRKALPVPDDAAFARQTYQAPQGEVEQTLAALWEELLGISNVGRRDNFFALGGHSLLAVRLMERLRRLGLGTEVRALFAAPELADLAAVLGQHHEAKVPPNRITPDTTALTPALLPLIELTQDDIDRVVAQIPGGVSNIQDVYALSPLQDGILFHHLFAERGDPYLLVTQLVFADRDLLDRYLATVQQVVDRHDILRTAFVWEQLSTPAQVVLRKTALPVIELELDVADGPISTQLVQRFHPRHYRLDLTEAPLLRFVIAREPGTSRWQVMQLLHHLIGDHATLETLHSEVQHFMAGQGDRLLAPQPYRHLIAQARGGLSTQEHERFFRSQLADIDEPTAPFGLTDVYHDGHDVTQAHVPLPATLNERLRTQARRQGVSLASLFHLAWGQVLARTSGRTAVVFGTVLFGRMHAGEGADRSMGLFINTLPLRLDMDHTGVADAVRLTHARLAELLRHEHASLALAQRCSGVAAPAPLFSTLLNYRHNAVETVDTQTSPLAGIEWLSGEERTNYPLALSVEDFGQTLGLTAQAIDPLDPARICALMQQTLEQLVEALEHAPQQPVRQLDVLPPDERELLLQTWNRTDAPYAETACLHQLFEQHVQRAPDAIAVVAQDQTLTYAALNRQANRLAHHLITLGIKPDDRVAVCMERSPNVLVSWLAILKAGGAYVPLDPAYASERLRSVLHDAAPRLLLSDAVGRDALGHAAWSALTVLDLAQTNAWEQQPDSNPQVQDLTAHHLAYVIYTSGSTGTPKGVMVEHRHVVHLAHAQHAYFQFAPHHRIAQFASISFDASLADIVMALTSGASLYLPAAADRQTGAAFMQYLVHHAITHATLPPALLQSDDALPSFPHRPTLLLAGEAPSRDLVRRLSAQATVVNAYGPTECTVWATSWTCPEHPDHAVVPIGRPITNARIYLLDEYGQPVPLGAVGEIHIGGAGVARGYLHQPALTAERFLSDPFHDAPAARMYKTGDLARYLPDGELEFLGRSDQQVKIRGFRIEPGEIEARLLEHPAVREVAVVARVDHGSDKRLVAYLVATDPTATMDLATDLRTYLNALLPSYMVPSAFVTLDALPLTPNGKLDRKALPAPDDVAFAREIYEAPQGEVEQTLAALWEELLGVGIVGRHDNFFALGGHSLLAVRLMERLRRLGLGAEVRALFTAPGLADLAAVLGQHREASIPPNLITLTTTAITPALLPLIELAQNDIDRIVEQVPGGVSNIQDIYALSPLQDGILFHHLFAERGDPYLLATQLVFADSDLLDRYLAAVQKVVDRHDILRTAFLWQHLSTPAQVVLRQATLSVVELELDPADGPIQSQLAQRFHPRHYRLDLTKAPQLRFVIAREPGTPRWQVLQLLHHLIGDHSTLETMFSEVQHLMAGQGDRLLPPQPFRHLIAQARGGLSLQEHERFFSNLLADIDEPTAPFGLTDVYHDGHDVTQAHVPLSAALNERLRTQARRQGVSLASLFHLAWGQVLARTSGRTAVVFGTVLFGRMHAGEGADRSMGLFINTLPLRLDMDHTGVNDAVRATHARLAELLRHEHASLALAQRCSGVAAPAPLFSTLLNYRHNTIEVSETAASPLSGIEWLESEERTNYPLVISVEDSGQTLGLTAQAIHPLDPARICALMQQTLEQLIEALERAPQQPVYQLDVLPPDERELLLHTWNHTEAPYPDAVCIHHLFEQQVQRAPDAMAVVGQHHRLTYQQLNQRANQLAHHLIALGVKPDDRIAVCVERSHDMLATLLAILKAGAAYVPLDPAYTGERLSTVLRDAAPVLLLSDSHGRTALDAEALTALRVVDLDHASAWEQQSDINPQVRDLTSRHLAYVIYTSGSTGTPKGVMVEHRQLVASTSARAAVYQTDAETRYLLLSSMAFDSSVAGIFGTLTSGGALHVLSREASQDPHAIGLYLLAARITRLLCVPSLADLILAQWETATSGENGTLRDVIVAGESCPASLARKAARLNLSLHNEYGPTEATVWATVHRYQPERHTSTSMPIGRPISNTRIYLLDEHGQPVPLGAAGEIHIGGEGVARGYLDRPELTAERFLADPFHPAPGARMYKTGDLARYLPDGELEFLGRGDQQVKIRGFRIEPGEIEARLLEHPAVRDVAVVARADQGADKRLVAYIVAVASFATVDLAADLRAHLDVHLPDYMVPAAFVTLDALPLTPNGKLDRKALPAPDDAAFARQTYQAPQGEVEQILAALWEELLGISKVGRHDNFFALGGHSLLAIRLMERLRSLGLGAEVRALFAAPGLADLAAVLGQHHEAKVPPNRITSDTTTLTPALLPLIELAQKDIDRIVAHTPGGVSNIQDIYALSPLQDGILFHHLLAERGDPYLSVGQMSFADRALLDRYLAAVQCVVDRHDILRTAFLWEHLSTPAQMVWRQATLPVIELELDPADGPIQVQLAQRYHPRHYRLDLTEAPLLRFVIAREPGTSRWQVMQLLHHLPA
jgi:amino acid adenylation domain-containing protein